MMIICSILLLAFISSYTDVGDFPPQTAPLWPRKTDKNAIVAMAAALGETHNGMLMRFDDNVTRGTAISFLSNTVAACRSGYMSYEMLPAATFPAMSSTIAQIFRTNYADKHGDIHVLGLSDGLSLQLNSSSASEISKDMATDTASAMKSVYGLDVSLFRTTGSRDMRESPIHTELTNEYRRVWNSALACGLSEQITLEEGIRGWWATSSSYSDSARDCAEWMIAGYRPLKFSPLTWMEADWCPDKLGMVFKHEGVKIPVEVRDRLYTSYGSLKITQRQLPQHRVELTYELSCKSNVVKVTTSTNWMSAAEFDIQNYAVLSGNESAFTKVTYSGVNFLSSNSTLVVHGDRYEVETNGNHYWAQKMGLMPHATTNSIGSIEYPVALSYATRSAEIIRVDNDISCYGEMFPSDAFGSRTIQMMYNVTCKGDKFDYDPIDVNLNQFIRSSPSETSVPYLVWGSFRNDINTYAADVTNEIKMHHDFDTCYIAETWTEELEGFPVDDDRSLINKDEVWVWEYGQGGGFLGHTHDFIDFSREIPAYTIAAEQQLLYAYPPNSAHEISARIKSAIFGWWHFCKWAY